MSAHVFCWGCAEHGVVNKVTAGLRCSCGSDDLDLFENSAQQIQRMAELKGSFSRYMTAASYNQFMASQPVGGDVAGWNEYTGPKPSGNTMETGVPEPMRCPVCLGAGYDIKDKTTCRECHGLGKIIPTTSPEPPMVAPHNYPNNATKVPFLGQRKQAATKTEIKPAPAPDWWTPPKDHSGEASTPFAMKGAACPNGDCNAQTTNLVHDYKNDAWWHCPNCGPLANVDRNPSINPYDPPKGFKPKPRQFRESKRVFAKAEDSGRLLNVVASVSQQNPGLRPHEVVGIARETVRRYPEAQ
jgi:hypothetical protein